MKKIDDLMQETKIDNLQNGELGYKENIDFNESDEKIGINYWRWKYYCGSITLKDHEECKKWCTELGNLIEIYDHIFYKKEVNEDFVKNKGLLDELSQLWVMRLRNNNDEYEKRLKDLIYQVYIKTNENKFREIALKYYEQMQGKNDNEIFLICNEENEKYKKKYGICEITLKCNSVDDTITGNFCGNKNDKDWIAKKFEEIING